MGGVKGVIDHLSVDLQEVLGESDCPPPSEITRWESESIVLEFSANVNGEVAIYT